MRAGPGRQVVMTYSGPPVRSSPTPRRLTRSREHVAIAGVCGGIADFLGWRPGTVRLLFVLSCVLPGPQVVAYLLLWLVIPKAPR
jgi:phage shock protein C